MSIKLYVGQRLVTKNGRYATVVAYNQDCFRVQYDGKLYQGSIDLIGKSFFIDHGRGVKAHYDSSDKHYYPTKKPTVWKAKPDKDLAPIPNQESVTSYCTKPIKMTEVDKKKLEAIKAELSMSDQWYIEERPYTREEWDKKVQSFPKEGDATRYRRNRGR